jgi:hypothetical protein
MTKLSLVQEKEKRSSALQNTPDLTDHQKTTGKTDDSSRNKGSQQVATEKQRKRKKRKAESLSHWRKNKRCRETRQSLIRDNNRASFSPVKFVMAIKTSALNTLTDRSIDE